MSQISPALVKELREKTNAGMMDCKRALDEAAGDMTKAEELLRKKGIASASKKASTGCQGGHSRFLHSFAGQGRRPCRDQLRNRFRGQERSVSRVRQRHYPAHCRFPSPLRFARASSRYTRSGGKGNLRRASDRQTREDQWTKSWTESWTSFSAPSAFSSNLSSRTRILRSGIS